MTKSERFEELMKNASKCFREERNPFDHSELAAHQVTLDECFDLSAGVANAIDYYLKHRNEAVDERIIEEVREAVGPDFAKEFEARLKFDRTLIEINKRPEAKGSNRGK